MDGRRGGNKGGAEYYSTLQDFSKKYLLTLDIIMTMNEERPDADYCKVH